MPIVEIPRPELDAYMSRLALGADEMEANPLWLVGGTRDNINPILNAAERLAVADGRTLIRLKMVKSAYRINDEVTHVAHKLHQKVAIACGDPYCGHNAGTFAEAAARLAKHLPHDWPLPMIIVDGMAHASWAERKEFGNDLTKVAADGIAIMVIAINDEWAEQMRWPYDSQWGPQALALRP